LSLPCCWHSWWLSPFSFAWRYREGNKKAKYSPNLTGNRPAEALWWFIPSVLIVILSIVTWRATHELDPYKPLASNVPAINVQVVALDWKWLFIYPQQHIASVNLLEFPVGTPLNFEITSDAPMNSFWIPQLGGQIYAMPGMSTQLHLMASSKGDFAGSSANISGAGFAGMDFTARATSQGSFNDWVQTVQDSPQSLSQQMYDQLARASENNPVAYYSAPANNLYNSVVDKYLEPSSELNNGDQSTTNMQAMGM
jgi:cytochrome o ubiquinol oxidase subunit 2